MRFFKSFITMLRVEYPEQQAIVDMLALIILTSLSASLIVTFIIFTQNASNLRNAIVVLITLVSAYLLLRIRALSATKFLVVFGIVIFGALLALTSYGIYTPIYITPVISIMLASFLYSKNMSLIVCFIAVSMGLGMVIVAEMSLIGLPDDSFLPPQAMWSVLSSIFIMIAIMSYFARHSMDKLLGESATYADKLKQRNKDLDLEISERESANEALRISEGRYRTVVEDQPNFIIRWQPDGTLTFVNKKYCEYHKKSEEELVGANFFDWSPQEVVETMQEKIRLMTSENPVIISTHAVNDKEGKQTWHQWIDRGIFDDKGKLIRVTSIGTDITSQKLLEEKMNQLQISKEREVFLNEFLKTMTHDLKTPLSIMTTSLYLAGKANTPEGQAKYLERISHQIKLQEKVINDILEIVRLNHLPEQQKMTFSINEIILNLKMQLSSKAEVKNIDFVTHLSPDLQDFTGDKEQIERLLLNLIENAINYNLQDGHITVRTAVEDEKTIIQVKDTGIGIPEEDRENIFNQFYRARNADKIEGGTGLGLAIVKRIVELHGGTIELKSEVNKGTTFTIRL